MRVCLIGKFPPIQGGVSALHYFAAHALARRGHVVHVVTNAREVEPAFRLMMRDGDWARCEADYPGGGAVRVHFTDGDHASQFHVPWHNPFASKLASLAAEAIRAHDLQLVSSYYVEPYAIAGHLAAEMTGRPHLILTAGSDAGRLLDHPQLDPLYTHVFSRAARIVTSSSGRQKLIARGIPEDRFAFAGSSRPLPEFVPEGPALDVAGVLRDMASLPHSPVLSDLCPPDRLPRPWIGIYGKHHEVKGTFDLLEAVAALARRGQAVGLLILGRGFDRFQAKMAAEIERLGLVGTTLQLPFLPPWRVPEYLRACDAVCYLERDFDVQHGPVVPREILACGRLLIASAEKLALDWALAGRAIHRYNCVAVRDVRDTDELAAGLQVALDGARAREIAARGHELWQTVDAECEFSAELEALLAEIAGEALPASAPDGAGEEGSADDAAADVLTRTATDDDDGGPTGHVLLFRLRGDLPAGGPGALYPSILPRVTFQDLPRQPASIAVVRDGRIAVTARVSSQARQMIESFDGSRTVSQIADEIAGDFAGDPDVKRAVEAAVMRYFRLGLIALSDHPAEAPLPSTAPLPPSRR